MRKTILSKVRKSTVGKEKAKAWKVFSEYIRKRDCLASTRTLLGGECYTCGRFKQYGELQAGHFIPGRHNAILFDERGVHAQCWWCNIQLHGNIPKYYKRMLVDYGQVVIDDLMALDGQSLPMKAYQYIEIQERYSEKIRGLEEGIRLL